MPELPEVETIKRSLIPAIGGRFIAELKIHTEQVFLANGFEITGYYIEAIRRRGKYLLFDLKNRQDVQRPSPLILLVHLRMTGQLLLNPTDRNLARHTHLSFYLADADQANTQVRLDFRDVRRFGRAAVYAADQNNEPIGASAGYYALGPEPFADEFSAAYLCGLSKRRQKSSLKAFLLDQKVVAGLGNIYVDESMFLAGLAPDKLVGSLTGADCQKLVSSIRQVLKRAIDYEGTSFSDYVDGWNRKGRFQEQLSVYGRGGQHCPRCNTTIVKAKLAGRTTSWCPTCQPD